MPEHTDPTAAHAPETPTASATRPVRPRDTRTAADRYRWELARGPIHAYGQSQTLAAWAQDPRCAVSRETLRTRLALGWPPERAISTGKHEQKLPTYTYNGREMTLAGWAEHLAVPYHTLYGRLTESGMTFEQAVERGGTDDWHRTPVTAFGQTKPLYFWGVDPRAAVDTSTIAARLKAGWNPRRAITDSPQTPGGKGRGKLHPAFGRRLTIPEWARLARIPQGLLRNRIATGTELEAVLRDMGWYPDWIDTRPAVIQVTWNQLLPGDTLITVEHGDHPDQARYTVRRTR